MILMVVIATELVALEPSKQLTTDPFRSLVTGLTVILDIRGKLSSPESLEAVRVELLIITCRSAPLRPMDVKTAIPVKV
ncbi:MAG: hypothetical protein MJE68_33430, partial [Proteobacteria bacterium]|nr:hypothetical protein [Pseudomonadota bacterium]